MTTRQVAGGSTTEDEQAEIVASRQALVPVRIAPEILPAITTIQPPAIVLDAGEKANKCSVENL
jgi:hypothetical protein